ncbi:MAG: hypothetical protein AABW73_02340 [Nanoarchaeota archaeon]
MVREDRGVSPLHLVLAVLASRPGTTFSKEVFAKSLGDALEEPVGILLVVNSREHYNAGWVIGVLTYYGRARVVEDVSSITSRVLGESKIFGNFFMEEYGSECAEKVKFFSDRVWQGYYQKAA